MCILASQVVTLAKVETKRLIKPPNSGRQYQAESSEILQVPKANGHEQKIVAF